MMLCESFFPVGNWIMKWMSIPLHNLKGFFYKEGEKTHFLTISFLDQQEKGSS